MASQWYRRTENSEVGPFSFEQLVQQIQNGELNEDGQVRRTQQRNWERVDEVIGLLRAARRAEIPRAAAARPLAERPALVPTAPSPRSWLLKPLTHDQLKRRGIPAAAVCVGFAITLSAWLTWPRRPPEISSVRLEFSIPSRLEQMRPRAPARPTVANLPDGRPVPVAGLEKVAWLSAPTFDNEMVTLVFVSVGSADTSDDLFIAERASDNDPFDTPAVIETCSGPGKEAYPALSANGLELIYTKLEAPNHRLMYSRRPDKKSKFGPSRPLEVAGHDFSDMHLDGPQFLGSDRIRFASGDTEYTERTQWVAERMGLDAQFRITATLALVNPWPRYFVAGDGRRIYFATEDGVFITVPDSTNGEFVVPEMLLSASVTGPIAKFDSPIWIAPQEDVLVFCSPGLDDPDSPDHRLWMIKLN